MNLAHPDRMYMLLILPGIALLLWMAAISSRRALERFGNPELLERAGMAVAAGRRAFKALLILVGSHTKEESN